MTKADRPIGVFDSGVGGLTVVRALMERLPFESIVYFGDTARVPYGIKSPDTIARYAAQLTRFLLAQDVKMLIVACNTMAAVAATRNATVGVIGTPTTINSNTYALRIHALRGDVRVHSQACALFVPLVEEGWLDHPVTRLTAEEYLKPVLAEGVDTLVLGCTHYPLLKPVLADIAGPQVRIVDSAVTTAEQAARVLDGAEGLRAGAGSVPRHRFYVTDVPLRFQTIAERFLGRALPEVVRVDVPE